MVEPLALTLAGAEELDADQLAVGIFEGEEPQVGPLPAPVERTIQALASRSGWKGREGQVAEAAPAEGGPVVSLRSLGKREELDARKLAAWIAQLSCAARTNGLARLAVALPDHPATGAEAAGRVSRQLMVSGYRFQRYKHEDNGKTDIESVSLVPPPGSGEAYRRELPAAFAAAHGVLVARELGNSPGNEANPAWMARQARALAEEVGLEVRVLEGEELERRNMGGLLAVGAGSAHPPRLVRLEWGDSGPRVALVGKGVTFDTGGISLKPPPAMDEMKYDKCGACAVLGAAVAVARLELPVRLTAYLPLAENMPDGRAYRPGDIVTCFNGKTVEILNTDAEGRMILADALSLAASEGAEHLVELSTLTGACVVALGRGAAGLYCPDDALAGELLGAAARSGERLWRMPTWPEYAEQMKGAHADLKNVSDRWGSANTAAAFLAQFVDPVERWAHLDIAGPAAVGKDGPGPQGASGYGVALVVDWLRRLTAG